MTDCFLGVQPIFDRTRQITAYELLFRDAQGDGPGESGVHGDTASAQVIVNAFADIGVERLGRDKKLFLNASDWLLASEAVAMLPPERIVLEVLEDARVTPELTQTVATLAGRGFEIALDDFVYAPAWDPLLRIAHIVKLDVLGLDEAAIRASLQTIPTPQPTLLAEKIEDKGQFERCLELGFALFQGYYLAHPRVLSGKRPPENRVQVLKILARLYAEDISLKEVEQLVSQDVSFSYRLLRFLGNAAISQCRPIHTLAQAISLVGLRTLRQWASLVLLSGLEPESRYSLTRSLTYARYCQLVAERALPRWTDALFTVGLFSNLDEILEIPLATALVQLPLDATLKAALLHHEGALGEVLASAIQLESVEAGEITPLHGIDASTLASCFLEALAWAQEVQAALSDA